MFKGLIHNNYTVLNFYNIIIGILPKTAFEY